MIEGLLIGLLVGLVFAFYDLYTRVVRIERSVDAIRDRLGDDDDDDDDDDFIP